MTIRIPFPPKNRPWFDPATGKPTTQFYRWAVDMQRRTGTQNSDYIEAAVEVAGEANSTVGAVAAGLTVPTPGGAVQLNPADPLSSITLGDGTATIYVAGHTRSGAAAAIIAGTVGPVAEGLTYYVYYNDPANNGGAVTFEANVSAASVGTKRLIGTHYVKYSPSSDGVERISGIQP